MFREIIFKIFKTFKHPYLYDRHSNSLVRLSDEEYAELTRVEKGELDALQSSVIAKYQAQGMLEPNVVNKIEHPHTMILGQYLKTRMKQLTLQVTQQCNLRCEYCVYSGIYGRSRTHSSERMSWETAKKAIDFFLRRSWVLPEVTIGFYGGEPMLEFDLIKKCVAYAESQVEGKVIKFNMTTNGTIMTDEMMDYLVEKNFILSVSLDGSKEEHDANRKFVDGRGSFGVIVSNIKRFHERYPEYEKNTTILTTINPHMDIECVLEYFSTSEIFSDKGIMFNSMVEVDLEQEVNYEEKFYLVRNFEYAKMLLSAVGKLDSKYVSGLTRTSLGLIATRLKSMRMHGKIPNVAHHGGPCLPGVLRLFVRADGALFPCERVGETIDYFRIGTLEDGIDVDKARKILSNGSITENECRNCWSISHCSICTSQIDFDVEPTKENKLLECTNSIGRAMFSIYELAVLDEFGYEV